jgi:hypothetical protein
MQRNSLDGSVEQAAMAALFARGLPARIDVATTAKLLNFADHDIPILVRNRKLTPLGDPAANAPKWFSTLEILRLTIDPDWLSKATREVAKHWRFKRDRQAKGAGANG